MNEHSISKVGYPDVKRINSNQIEVTWEQGYWHKYKRKRVNGIVKLKSGYLKKASPWMWILTGTSKPRPPMQPPPNHLMTSTASTFEQATKPQNLLAKTTSSSVQSTVQALPQDKFKYCVLCSTCNRFSTIMQDVPMNFCNYCGADVRRQ